MQRMRGDWVLTVGSSRRLLEATLVADLFVNKTFEEQQAGKQLLVSFSFMLLHFFH